MARVYRLTVRINMVSGVARDSAQNVHHVISQEDGIVPTATMEEWCGDFDLFYSQLAQFLSPAVSRLAAAHTIDVAALNTGEAGRADDVLSAPLYQHTFDIPALDAGRVPLPSEVAVCLSHRGFLGGAAEETGNTRPRSRRRGRFYVGPLNTTAVQQEVGTNTSVVSPVFMGTMLNSFEQMVESLASDAEIPRRAAYGVYSPTADTFYSVEEAHVDNAFDTMRRRGQVASSRETRIIDLEEFHQGDVTEAA